MSEEGASAAVVVTVVTMLPFAKEENKPGLYPGKFILPKAEPGDIEVLIVKNAVSHVYLDESRGSLAKPELASEVGRSIVQDLIQGQLGIEGDAKPGLFYVEGAWTKAEVKEKFADKVEFYRNCQIEWFKRLVAMADDDWSRSGQHKSVSDLQRYAAKFLGLEREWLMEIKQDLHKMKKCIFCFQDIPREAIKCMHCREVVDAKRYAEMTETVTVAKLETALQTIAKA